MDESDSRFFSILGRERVGVSLAVGEVGVVVVSSSLRLLVSTRGKDGAEPFADPGSCALLASGDNCSGW
jgi:hypothetical protein